MTPSSSPQPRPRERDTATCRVVLSITHVVYGEILSPRGSAVRNLRVRGDESGPPLSDDTDGELGDRGVGSREGYTARRACSGVWKGSPIYATHITFTSPQNRLWMD